ncbi:MAG: hypothetical protein IJ568_01685 [Bacilli bacterium]|nr:hypothetical protein [Bacilli bacterium]
MMERITKEELKNLDGGDTITGTLITAISQGLKTLVDIGRSFGSSIRRIKDKRLCEIP